MYVTTPNTFPGGTTVNVPLKAGPDYASTQIAFAGRATGTVTVTARGYGSDKFDAITGGAVNLATTGTLVIAGFSLAELKFVDAGSGTFDVTVIQRT